MKRTSTVWLIYLLALVATTAAMGWVTHHTLQLEREEKLTALRAENERLALWRMESVLLPFVSSESSRDYSEWGSFEWGNREHSGKSEAGEPTSPGDLVFTVRFGSPYVAEYFRCDSTGRFATGNSITVDTLAGAPLTPETEPDELASFGSDASREALFATTREAREAFPLSTTIRNRWMPVPEIFEPENPQQAENQSALPFDPGSQQVQTLALGPEQQRARSSQEFQRRMNNTGQNGSNFISQVAMANGFSNSANSSPIGEDGAGPMTAFWLDDDLILARHVSRENWEAVEGGILNQDAISQALLAEVRGMFPSAKLAPAESERVDNPLALASLPLKLIPGAMPVDESRGWTPMSTSLAIARAECSRHRRAASGSRAAQRTSSRFRFRRHARTAIAAHHVPIVFRSAGGPTEPHRRKTRHVRNDFTERVRTAQPPRRERSELVATRSDIRARVNRGRFLGRSIVTISPRARTSSRPGWNDAGSHVERSRSFGGGPYGA
jgi:hypothetical protein